MHQRVPEVNIVDEPVPDGAGVNLPSFHHVAPSGAGGSEERVRVGVGKRGHGRVEREAEVGEPVVQGGFEDDVAGERVRAAHKAEETQGVVERAREEAAGEGGGGEEEEAAGSEGVGEEARGEKLRVDLEEVPRGVAPGEVRVQEGHREHDQQRAAGTAATASERAMTKRAQFRVGGLGRLAAAGYVPAIFGYVMTRLSAWLTNLLMIAIKNSNPMNHNVTQSREGNPGDKRKTPDVLKMFRFKFSGNISNLSHD